MRKHAIPTALLLALTLALAACMPEPPSLVLSVSNQVGQDEANACITLRATITYPQGPIEVGAVDPGEQLEAAAGIPEYLEGQPITVEAWCETASGEGYAKLEGAIAELTTKVNAIHVSPPSDQALCRIDLAASTDPAPCINTSIIN